MPDLPDGWLLDGEAGKLAELATHRTVLELGAWKGRSTVAMARTAWLVVSVDWHRGDIGTGAGDTLDEYLGNVRDLANVVPIIGRFEEILPLWLAPVFDLVFVDGAHDYESASRDLRYAQRFARIGGVIACHDWGTHPDCTRAIAHTFGREPDEIVQSLAIYEKRLTQRV